jgi:hypothetical protein
MGYSVIMLLALSGVLLADGPSPQNKEQNPNKSFLAAARPTEAVSSGVQVSNQPNQQPKDRKLEVSFNEQADTFDPNIKEGQFDMDRFLEELENIDCSRNENSLINQENSLCEDKLADLTLEPLGASNSGKDEMFDYLNDQIYQPLAYEANKKESLSDMILAVLDLKEKKMTDRALSLNNYGGFQKSVLSTFSEIAAKSENVKDNEEAIRNSSVDLLKKFHVYWNIMRSQGQISRLKEDTKQVVQSLLTTYQLKRDFQNFVLKTMVKSIVKAYYRFIKAHKMVEVLNKRGDNMLAKQMVIRYKAVAELYLTKNVRRNSFARDISNFIYMLESLYLISYKQGLDDSAMVNTFENQVVKAIQDQYLEYEDMLNGDEDNDRLIINIRNFTATLLLKMKHQTYIIFNLNGISQFVNHQGINYLHHPTLVKLYYDLYDNLITIPQTCVSFLLLKHCYVYEVTRTFRYLLGKFLLSRSTMGCRFYDIINALVQAVSSKADSTVWDNWGLFKQYYYENLFSVLETFRSTYHVNSMDSVENLENLIVAELDHFREQKDPGVHRNPIILEKLDKSLYSEFIAIKSDFNQFAPVERNQRIVAMLGVRLHKFLGGLKDASVKRHPLVLDLIDRLETIVDQWVANVASAPEVSFNIGNPSLAPTVQNMNLVESANGELLEAANQNISPELQESLESPSHRPGDDKSNNNWSERRMTLTGKKTIANEKDLSAIISPLSEAMTPAGSPVEDRTHEDKPVEDA